MPYGSISEIPKQLRTAGLSLKQANEWASIYDALKRGGQVSSPAAVAWNTFKKKYKKIGANKWVLKKKNTSTEQSTSLKGYELFYRESPNAMHLEDVECEGKMYEKELIREGEWAHPQKPSMKFKVDIKRMKEWINNFNKNLFKVPVPKRHSLDPEDNRGWVKDLFIKKRDNVNILFGKLDITNEKMQYLIDNGDVQDVSISIGPYTDNKGTKHGEALQHVALTVIPHIDSQSGFKSINAEGYICLEEVNQVDSVEKLNYNDEIAEFSMTDNPVDGSKEAEFMKLHDAIEQAKIFNEPDKFEIVATFNASVIVKYYGSGEGADGLAVIDRYFEIPYTTSGFDKHFEFGNKKEVEKKIYFVTKTQETVNSFEKDDEENNKKENKEVNNMDTEKKELEKKQEEVEEKKEDEVDAEATDKKEEKKEEKVDLEKVSAENETLKKANTDLEAKVTDLEKQVQEYKDKEKADFEAKVDNKIDAYVKSGKIAPAETENIKKVLLENSDASKVLETILEGRKVIDFETKTEQKSDKPQDGINKSKAEAERISKLGNK